MACKRCSGVGAVPIDGEFKNCPVCYCAKCSGTRVIFGENGVEDCSCVWDRKPLREMAISGVPERYKNVDFESYETNFSTCSESQKMAKIIAQSFAREKITSSCGLVFHGTLGVGKTHLAIAILKERIKNWGFSGRYYDGNSFIRLIQGTYGARQRGDLREADIMTPVLACDVLVLDDLGAFKVTDDRQEIMAHVLTTRYNEAKTTIITTNFPFNKAVLDPDAKQEKNKGTLGDRVGDRVFSRLEQMCVPVYIDGSDMRSSVMKARFNG